MIPGVDDGAKNMEIAIQMLQFSMNEGVNEMILTPHFNIPSYINEDVERQYRLLYDHILENAIEFKLHLGNEIYLSQENMAGIESEKAYTMGESHYLLLELPYYHFYPFHEVLISNLQSKRYKVLLAHVERYDIFSKKPKMIEELVYNGVYAQLTSEYIINKKTRKKALNWIERGLVNIVASDGHNVDRRPPVMKMAYEIVSKVFGESCAQLLFEENPRLMIEDGILVFPEIKRTKRFSLFSK
jgi:protein-tyrosine phosphatase